MSTQYNTIQGPYDSLRQKSIAIIEHENVQTTVAPFIQNARVLELACGSGYYTYDFLKWGASAVVGVDISPVMVEEARRKRHPQSPSGSVDFILADCTQPTVYAGGPFDLVFGAWLLNYAPDRAGLVAMFRNVAGNLRAGGRFVSVTVPPARDPTAAILAETKARPPPDGSGGFNNRILHDVDGGVCFRVYGATELGNMAFDCYHLRSDLYEAAAREAGLSGDWTWDVTAVPDRFLRGDGPGGASIAELKSYQTVPGFGLLVVTK